jgi:hypothetical protein
MAFSISYTQRTAIGKNCVTISGEIINPEIAQYSSQFSFNSGFRVRPYSSFLANSEYLSGGLTERDRPEGGSFEHWHDL